MGEELLGFEPVGGGEGGFLGLGGELLPQTRVWDVFVGRGGCRGNGQFVRFWEEGPWGRGGVADGV